MELDYHPGIAHRLEVPLVLLHGWGFDQRIWRELLPELRGWTDVVTVPLSYQTPDPELLLDRLSQSLPPKAILLGWSLGGILATGMAARFPDKVRGLINLATNGTFVARSSWPHGVELKTFEQFSRRVRQNPELGLKRFCQWATHGDQHSAEQLDYLCSLTARPDSEELLAGLTLLKALDNTHYLRDIRCPALHLFGQRDSLVPPSARNSLSSILPDHHRMQVLTNRGHILHQPVASLLPLLNDFLAGFACRDR